MVRGQCVNYLDRCCPGGAIDESQLPKATALTQTDHQLIVHIDLGSKRQDSVRNVVQIVIHLIPQAHVWLALKLEKTVKD